MSYILDALKKSESERQRQHAPGIADVPAQMRGRKIPVWIWLLGGLLFINAAVLSGVLFRGASQAPVVAAPSIAVEPAPVSLPRAEPSVAAAVIEQPPESTIKRREPIRAAAAPSQPTINAVASLPAPTRSSESAAVSESALPTLMELRANGRVQLPDLHLDVHVYSSSPSDRFVFVNMSKYKEQSRLSEGPLLKEIRQDGIVLEYQGNTFLLPRE